MPILIKIPSPLRGLTHGQKTVEAEGSTVSEVILDLDAKYPGIREKLYDQKTMRPFVNIYLNNEDIRVLNKAEGRYKIDISTPVKDGDQLFLIPPIAGGVGGPSDVPFRQKSDSTIQPTYHPSRSRGEGQRKLLLSRILLIGMGGLGSPAALYLAAAGIGTLGPVDFDTVMKGNLNVGSRENVLDD